MQQVDTPQKPAKRGLNLLDSTMVIMGSMIGSGIFIVSADIARTVHSPGLLIMAWVASGVITLLGAISYGELAAAMPKAGGQYIYLKEAYGPMMGFLFGWTVFTVVTTGVLAAVAVAFARFTGVFFDVFSDGNYLFKLTDTWGITYQQVLAVAVLVGLTLFNFREVKSGALLNNAFTFGKIGALVLVLLLGVYAGMAGLGDWSRFTFSTTGTTEAVTLAVFASALVGSLFSSDAWNNITYTAGEVENPKRNLPLSLLLGTGSVCALYLLANFAYVYVLPLDTIQAAPSDRVGTALMQTVVGDAATYIMAALVMLSTFGCVHVCILAGARLYYAMAKDGLFFKKATELNRHGSPAPSLAMQCFWACLLVFSGNYGQLLNYVMFAQLLFYVLTVVGLFVLRVRRPDMERPYKVVGYPFVPLLYILLAGFTCFSILVYRWEDARWGAVIVLLGIPAYYWFKRKGTNS